ncbi:g7501 [Coccomyxa elongata]
MGQAQSSDQFLTQDGRYKQQTSQPGNSQLQNALPLTSPSSSQYNHGALTGAQTSPGVVQPSAVQGERLPLFYWFGKAAWDQTHGTARVDLMRPRFPDLQPGGNLFQARPARKKRTARMHARDQFVSGGAANDYLDPQESYGLFGRPTGARIKIMRSIQIGRPQSAAARPPGQTLLPQGTSSSPPAASGLPKAASHESEASSSTHDAAQSDAQQIQSALKSVQTKLGQSLRAPERPLFDLGVGLSYELDTSDASLLVRLKVKDWFSLRVLPNQVLKVNKRWQLGNSPVALRVNYECPLDNLSNPFQSPSRLMVRMENCVGKSVHLTPSGIDFDEHVFRLGQGTVMRAAGSVLFPRQLPVEEGEKLVNFKVQRFGLKALW